MQQHTVGVPPSSCRFLWTTGPRLHRKTAACCSFSLLGVFLASCLAFLAKTTEERTFVLWGVYSSCLYIIFPLSVTCWLISLSLLQKQNQTNEKTKKKTFSSGLIWHICSRRESWRNTEASQRGDEFGGICQTHLKWNELCRWDVWPRLSAEAIREDENSGDTDASAFQALPQRLRDDSACSPLIFLFQTHTRAFFSFELFW